MVRPRAFRLVDQLDQRILLMRVLGRIADRHVAVSRVLPLITLSKRCS